MGGSQHRGDFGDDAVVDDGLGRKESLFRGITEEGKPGED